MAHWNQCPKPFRIGHTYFRSALSLEDPASTMCTPANTESKRGGGGKPHINNFKEQQGAQKKHTVVGIIFQEISQVNSNNKK